MPSWGTDFIGGRKQNNANPVPPNPFQIAHQREWGLRTFRIKMFALGSFQKPSCSFGIGTFLFEDGDIVSGQETLPSLFVTLCSRALGVLGACPHGCLCLTSGCWPATCLHAGLDCASLLHVFGVLLILHEWKKNGRNLKIILESLETCGCEEKLAWELLSLGSC